MGKDTVKGKVGGGIVICRIASNTTALPVSVGEVKDHLRVDSTYDDVVIRSMIISGAELAENKTDRSLTVKQYEITLDDFPGDTYAIPLLYPPVSSSAVDVVITYLDESSHESTTLPATCYTVDYKSLPNRIYPASTNEWPDVSTRTNAVTVTYYSGYSTCPEPIKTWIKMYVGALYENREGIINQNQNRISRPWLDGLLDPYVVPQVY